MTNYAIQVRFEDSWLYLSEGPIDDLRISIMSLEDAQEVLEAWTMYASKEHIRIVEYNP